MADVDGAGKLTDHVGLGALTRVVPRHVVDEVLAKTGRKEKRSRSLPAHVVVYFVLALALFTDGYEEVIRKLVHGLRFARTWDRAWVVPTTGALSQARTRLGAAPLKALFETVAVPVAAAGTPGAWLRSWRVMALDGVMIDVPDTAANLAHYDKPSGGTRRPYPQLRAVGLCEVGTRAVVGAAMGTIRTGERALAATLTGNVGPGMVITADRGFFCFDLWRDYALTGAQLLWRLSATTILEPTEVLADGSYLAEITGKHTRTGMCVANARSPPTACRLIRDRPARVVEYTVHTDPNDPASSSEVFRLITTILDPAEVTAPELAAAYHERWEQETAFREIEISLRNGRGMRSKTPDLVAQEFYGLLLTHYAIRSFMVEAADTVEMDPDRISFTRTLHIVRRRITDPAAFSPQRTTNPPRP